MNIVVCFLAIVVLAGGTTQMVDPLASRSISSSMEDFFIYIREQMPCGFPNMGIPAMAPFVISHQNINIDTPAFRLNSTIDEFSLHNLNSFEIAEMKVNLFKSKVIVRFIFKNVYVDTRYSLEMYLKKFGFTINMIGAGHAKFEIKKFEIWGTFKYSLGVISNNLKFKSIDIRIRIGDVVSNIDGVFGDGPVTKKMNDILEVAVPAIFNENENFISKTIESNALPVVNDFLSAYRLDELLATIGSGEGEHSKCEPLEP